MVMAGAAKSPGKNLTSNRVAAVSAMQFFHGGMLVVLSTKKYPIFADTRKSGAHSKHRLPRLGV